jgi:hypothetical protein
MIATKKAKLIRKHLGVNTPNWIVSNCIKLLNEYEEIELCNVPETKANDADTGQDKCYIQRVCNCDNPEIHINKKTGREWCFNCWQKLKKTDC